MGLDAIIDAIAAEAESHRAEIRAETDARVDEILRRARAGAAEDQDRLEHARDEEAQRASARIKNRAQLEADRQLARARELLFQESLDRLRDRLTDIVAGPGYEEILLALYSEAASVVPDDDATILVRAADRRSAEGMVTTGATVSRIDASLQCTGGVDIEAKDGRAVRNTLDARLRRCESELRHLAVQLIADFENIGAGS
jgi:vacuolar-type H+-ATPase subunit E/Vma4